MLLAATGLSYPRTGFLGLGEIRKEVLVRNYDIAKMTLRFYTLSSLPIIRTEEGSKFVVREKIQS